MTLAIPPAPGLPGADREPVTVEGRIVAATTCRDGLGDPGQAALTAHLRDMRRRNVRPATLLHREANVRRVARWFAPGPLLAATADDLEQWVDDLIARGLAEQSRATYTTHVRMFFAWCFERGLIAFDPAAGLVVPRVQPGRPRPIPEDALRLALMTATQPLRAWLVLGAYAGLRSGEIARLRREHVLDGETPPLLVVEDGKGGRSRVVPLSAAVLDELRPHLAGLRQGRLWLETHRRPQVIVTNRVSQHMRQLGLNYTCHQLRHRFGTRTYQASRDLRMVQDLLGHASAQTTQVYAGWDNARGVEIVEQLGDDLDGTPDHGGQR